MPSQALVDFHNRLGEVQQLVDAHGALIRFKNAESAFNSGGQLKNIAQVVQHLVSTPGPGRPPEVQALNSAGIALLSAHFQGFVTDLYKEVALHTLKGKVKDLDAVISTANKRGNPNEQNITRLFDSIGYSNVLDGISWQKMNNKQLRDKIRSLNELRNKIVHGSSDKVKKSTLTNFLSVIRSLAEKLDEKLRGEVKATAGKYPW